MIDDVVVEVVVVGAFRNMQEQTRVRGQTGVIQPVGKCAEGARRQTTRAGEGSPQQRAVVIPHRQTEEGGVI